MNESFALLPIDLMLWNQLAIISIIRLAFPMLGHALNVEYHYYPFT